MTAERARMLQEEEEGAEPSSSLSSAVAVAASSSLDVGSPNSGSLGAPVMVGTHFHSLDEKGRVIIPAKLREALTEQFWMMLDENDNIGLYPYATGMDILEHCERTLAEFPDDEDVAAAVMRITEAADLVIVESAYRVPVPELLRFCAGLGREVVTVGALNHAVLWDRTRWEEWQASKDSSVDVRKKQASLMRAAASGARRREEQDEAARRAEEEAQAQALERAYETARQRDAERSASPARGRKVASSGDGGRSPGVLKLSDLGR